MVNLVCQTQFDYISVKSLGVPLTLRPSFETCTTCPMLRDRHVLAYELGLFLVTQHLFSPGSRL